MTTPPGSKTHAMPAVEKAPDVAEVNHLSMMAIYSEARGGEGVFRRSIDNPAWIV